MEFILVHLAFLEGSYVYVSLYVFYCCIVVSLSLVGCLFTKFTLLSIKRKKIPFVFTLKQSGIYFLRKFVTSSTLSRLFGIVALKYGTYCLRR